jgi:hypothetical protein
MVREKRCSVDAHDALAVLDPEGGAEREKGELVDRWFPNYRPLIKNRGEEFLRPVLRVRRQVWRTGCGIRTQEAQLRAILAAIQ